jgi:hypothetical protein
VIRIVIVIDLFSGRLFLVTTLPSDGILSSLAGEYRGNIHEKGIVEVSASGVLWLDCPLSVLVDVKICSVRRITMELTTIRSHDDWLRVQRPQLLREDMPTIRNLANEIETHNQSP